MKISHLNALRALEATLRKGSFTAASAELGVTPAAVGQRIQALEEYIERNLFHRTATGATPTAEARSIQTALNNGFSELAGVLENLHPEPAAKQVAVTMPESFAENWFGLVVSDFTAAHPQVSLHLDASNRDYDLKVEKFDFAIRYGSPIGAHFEETFLFGDSVQPVCSPEFASRYNLSAGHSDLSGVPLLHVHNRTGDPNWIGFEEWGRTFDVEPSSLSHGVRFSKAGSGLQSAMGGEGLVMSGLVEAFHALADGRLTMPFGASRRQETTYKYRLLKLRDAQMSASQIAFADWLVQRAIQYKKDVGLLLKNYSN